MSYKIQEHIEALSTQKIFDRLFNSMIEGVVGLNDKSEIILSNKMADQILPTIDKSIYSEIKNQINATFHSKGTEFNEYTINSKYYVFIMSYIDRIQQDGRSGL